MSLIRALYFWLVVCSTVEACMPKWFGWFIVIAQKCIYIFTALFSTSEFTFST